MSRASRIHEQLEAAERRGAIRGYQSYSPGDWRGRRWVIEAAGGTSMVGTFSYSTLQAEAFCAGLAAEQERSQPEAGASRRYLPAPGEGEEPGDRLLTALLEEAESRLGPLREWRVTYDGQAEAQEAKCWGRLGFLWLRAEPAGEGAVDVTALEERRV